VCVSIVRSGISNPWPRSPGFGPEPGPCNKICQKIYFVLRGIRPHASYTPLPVRKKLINSLIKPHLDYGNIVFSTYDSASKRKLQKAYNACLRYVYKRSKRDSLQDIQTSLWGLTPENSAKVQQLTFLFKILHLRHPSYLYTLFTFASSARMRNLITPIHRTLGKVQSFTVVGTKAWNSLPRLARFEPMNEKQIKGLKEASA
jgi:hypothetical protein